MNSSPPHFDSISSASSGKEILSRIIIDSQMLIKFIANSADSNEKNLISPEENISKQAIIENQS